MTCDLSSPAPDTADSTGRPPSAQPWLNMPPVTLGLILLNIMVFIMGAFLGNTPHQWLEAGGFVPAIAMNATHPDHVMGLARVFSAQFLHAGLAHLVVNMFGLMAFGSGIERLWGKARLLMVFFAGGVLGFMTYASLYPTSSVPMVGASAGISALFGALLPGLTLRKGGSVRGFFMAAWAFILSNVAIGLVGMPAQPGLSIAWQAHIAGFLLGVLIALRRMKKRN